jgi:hypothetical protein
MDSIKDDFNKLLAAAKKHDATIYEFLSHYNPERWLSYDHVHNLYDKIKEEAINRSIFVKISNGSSLDKKQGLISRMIYEHNYYFEIVETKKGVTTIAKDQTADFLKIESFSSQPGLRDGEGFISEFEHSRLTIFWSDELIVYEPGRTTIRRIGESFIEIDGSSMRFCATAEGVLYSATLAFNVASFTKNVSVFFRQDNRRWSTDSGDGTDN